jgi:hypothetical protein
MMAQQHAAPSNTEWARTATRSRQWPGARVGWLDLPLAATSVLLSSSLGDTGGHGIESQTLPVAGDEAFGLARTFFERRSK